MDKQTANLTPRSHICSVGNDGLGFITVVFGIKPFTIRAKDAGWDKAFDAYCKKDWKTLYDAMNPATEFVQTYSKGRISVINGQVMYDKTPVHGTITKRILYCLDNGIPGDHLALFLENLMLNPSAESREELFDFLENVNIPITENGTFLAYKGVRSDYYSITSGSQKLVQGTTDGSGRIFNGVGETIEMKWDDVDNNRRNECSYGLHAGTHTYANNFKGGGKLVMVEINPKDVVSVPKDYNFAKLRTCKYVVIANASDAIEEMIVSTQKVNGTNEVAITPTTKHNVRDNKGRFAAAVKAFTPKPTVKHNVRDNKGRFTSAKPSPVVAALNYHNKRDNKGRFTK